MKHIPGTVSEEGREFFYMQVSTGEGFSDVVDAALASCPDVPLPKSGGIIEEKARLRLADCKDLLAVSYRGDNNGWRKKMAAFCILSNRIFGIANGDLLELSDGTSINLVNAHVTWDE